MKTILMVFLVLVGLFLVSCGSSSDQSSISENPLEENSDTNLPAETETPNPEIIETASKPKIKCTHTANCSIGEYCLNGNCGKLIDEYQTKDCQKKCKVSSVKIDTSDGETYDLALGQGSYTAASALEWKTLSAQEFCTEDDAIVFIKITKRNYANILGDEVITLKDGEASKVITHPLMPKIKFTLTLKSLEKVCS